MEKKQYYQKRFEGSDSLFEACWRQLLRWIREGAIDTPIDDQQVMGWLDQIAAEKVNDSRSPYFIYG